MSALFTKETQAIFKLLLDKGLAYKAKGVQDYCPKCETVLAREQVKNGNCERHDIPIEKKELKQWYFKITDYKDRLIKNLDTIYYPEKTKKMQRAWLENLHDWCVSRQRKWGCSIPIENEEDTLDTFVDSSFYYIVYQLWKGLVPKQVDLYIGGSEHACMHLIYARFICMVMYDAGLIDFAAPIILEGHLLGTMLGGQVLINKPVTKNMRRSQRKSESIRRAISKPLTRLTFLIRNALRLPPMCYLLSRIICLSQPIISVSCRPLLTP